MRAEWFHISNKKPSEQLAIVFPDYPTLARVRDASMEARVRDASMEDTVPLEIELYVRTYLEPLEKGQLVGWVVGARVGRQGEEEKSHFFVTMVAF